MLLKFKLNGLDVKADVEPGEFLFRTLRNLNVKSLKKGCDGSACGACTVLLDEKPVLSCSVLSLTVEGHEVRTVEIIQDEASKLADCFASEGADQCGYCNSAISLVVHALRKENPNASEDEIRKYLVGNLCRCTGYQAQVKAVKKYLGGSK
jgi:carbon-monoxide dehydrogenase small subunit